VLIGLSLAVICTAEPSDPPRDSWSVDQLIAALTDPDASIRKAASSRLVRMGVTARPQLLKAARSDDPEQRAQAAAILKKLPWWAEGDPANIVTLLERYGDAGEIGRIALIRRLDDLAATEVMLRLLSEEPGDTVRWSIAGQLGSQSDARTLDLARQLQPADDDPPALTLAGVAWLPRDRAKALQFLRRAIEADEQRPSNDGGRLGFAFDRLIEDSLARGAYDDAAALLRRQVPREMTPRRQYGLVEGVPTSLAVLLMLHDYFGPLDGYARDVQAWNASPRNKSAAAAVTELFSALGHSPPTPQGLTSKLSIDDRFSAAIFFLNRELATAAELELRAALAMAKPQPELYDSRILLLLAHIKADSNDDLTVADLIDRALKLKTRNDFRLEERSEDDLMAELHWRRARAAQRAGDDRTADEQIAALLRLTPTNSDSTINIINWLRETTRHRESKLLFDKIYQQTHAKLESANDKAGPRNDLAWFCARTGNRIDEALKMAQAAVEDQPQKHEFLDTLAECHYRAGHREEAIKYESRAVELKPESAFFRQQLERFRAGKP
jgi:tetratricopeptide (TPR) repeat protein